MPPGVTQIRVPDSRSALARLAAAYYRLRPGQRAQPIRFIGVTGTNGKSTVCELLHSILAASGQPAALVGTIRYELPTQTLSSSLTTPPPVELCEYLARAADAGAQWAVMEVSSHALDQRRCDGLEFAAGVFTNLSGDHLDYHGDRGGRSQLVGGGGAAGGPGRSTRWSSAATLGGLRVGSRSVPGPGLPEAWGRAKPPWLAEDPNEICIETFVGDGPASRGERGRRGSPGWHG